MKIAIKYSAIAYSACFFMKISSCFSFENEASKAETFIESLSIPAGCHFKAKKDDILVSNYEGYLIHNNTIETIDSTYERERTFVFRLGSEKILTGFSEGFHDMCLGEKRRIFIPPELAYGETGITGKTPPNYILLFEIELIDILSSDTESPYIE